MPENRAVPALLETKTAPDNLGTKLGNKAGWVGRTRTCTLLYQKQVHYHYATTHQRGRGYAGSADVSSPEIAKIARRAIVVDFS